MCRVSEETALIKLALQYVVSFSLFPLGSVEEEEEIVLVGFLVAHLPRPETVVAAFSPHLSLL